MSREQKSSLPCQIPSAKKKQKLPNFYGQSYYFSVPKPKTAPLERQDNKSELPHSEGDNTGASVRNFMQSENRRVHKKNDDINQVEKSKNVEEVLEEENLSEAEKSTDDENRTNSNCDDNIFQFDEELPKFSSFRG